MDAISTHLRGLLQQRLWVNPDPEQGLGRPVGSASGQGGSILHCGGQANCADSSNQWTNTTVFSLTFNNFIFSSNTPPISTFHHGQTANGYFRDVWRHQNNVACVWVVGLQMFFFSSLPSHFFFFIFQIKEHVLLLRPKTGRVIYTRILTPASQCLQDVVSLNSQSLSLASSPPHSLPQRTIQI